MNINDKDWVTISCFSYEYDNNPFNSTIDIVQFDDTRGCFLLIRNYEGCKFDYLYDQFCVDVLYNEIVDITQCEWSHEKISLLHQWVKTNFVDIMKIWEIYMFRDSEDICTSNILKTLKC